MAINLLSSAARREASSSESFTVALGPRPRWPGDSLVILRKMLRRQFVTSSPKHGRMRYHSLEFGSTCDRSASTAGQSGSGLRGASKRPWVVLACTKAAGGLGAAASA